MFSKKRKFGNLGEDVVVLYLKQSGHIILDRNYFKRSGEIDIVSKKDGIIHFFEVKSKNAHVPHETYPLPDAHLFNITAFDSNNYEDFTEFPEENVNYLKQSRMSDIIHEYIKERPFSDDQELQVDIVAVLLDINAKKAKIRITHNIVFT